MSIPQAGTGTDQAVRSADDGLSAASILLLALLAQNAGLSGELDECRTRLDRAEECAAASAAPGALAHRTREAIHDFNNALTGILGRADMALKLTREEPVARHLKIIVESALKASETIRGLREFVTRYESGIPS